MILSIQLIQFSSIWFQWQMIIILIIISIKLLISHGYLEILPIIQILLGIEMELPETWIDTYEYLMIQSLTTPQTGCSSLRQYSLLETYQTSCITIMYWTMYQLIQLHSQCLCCLTLHIKCLHWYLDILTFGGAIIHLVTSPIISQSCSEFLEVIHFG